MTKNSPLVSIVTPVLNGEKYIAQTIESVLQQSHKNIEYIIVDGNSSDNTISIIKKYQKYLSFFINKNQISMYDNLYYGFKNSTGKYFCWINSDDILFKNSIESAVKIMENNKFDWITGKTSTIKRNGKIFTMPFPYLYPTLMIKNGWAYKCKWGYIQQESTIFTKKLYLKSGGINNKFKYAGDFDLWRRFSHHCKLYSVDFKIGAFRQRDGQLSENQSRYLSEVGIRNCIFHIFNIPRLFYSCLFFIIRKITNNLRV